jgi:hypothetical protein
MYTRFVQRRGAEIMADRNPIHIEPESDTARLLERIGDQPVTVESRGEHFRIERERRATLENYDPVRALAALRQSAGALANIDVEAFKQRIREEREQNSKVNGSFDSLQFS